MLTRQVHYHLSHSVSPVLCWIFFEIWSLKQLAQTGLLLISAS
jgi:hypothetical protein